MKMDVFLAQVGMEMDVWNATCSAAETMNWENYGRVWELDHNRPLGGANGDIAEKLLRCAAWYQQPMVHRKHGQKSNSETRIKTQAMMDDERTNLTNLVTEARENVSSSERVWGRDSERTMDRLEVLGNALSNAGRHGEALTVEQDLRSTRATVLGWDDPATLDSCRRLASVHGELDQHDDAIRVLAPALDAHRQQYGPKHPNTLSVVLLMAKSLCTQGHHTKVEQLVLGLSDDEMAHRAAARQVPEVRCRSGLVSVLASCPRFDLRFHAEAHDAKSSYQLGIGSLKDLKLLGAL